jgi:hypothetical protein
MARITFDQIRSIAALPKNASNRDTVLFHYFNPNGAVAAKRASDERIYEAVAAGKCKSGVIYAHGGMNRFYEDKLSELVNRQRVSNFDARYYVAEIYNEVKKADAFLADIPDFARPDGFVAA